tara:strand:+ start:1415 stop:1561 length:147 start_codon:yes stop_codon:yes gene_type:complete
MELKEIAKEIVEEINKSPSDYDATDKTIEILKEHFESNNDLNKDVLAK